jgi:hypothetical protein
MARHSIPIRTALLSVVALVGCTTPAASPVPSATVVALPTLPSVPRVCLGVGGGGGARLTGNPTDPRVTWIEGFGNRGEIVWPPGYTARFAPALEVLDASGKVVYREGDEVQGGCAVGPPDDPPSLLLILPPRR